MRDNARVTRVTIVGGGPGGYEAALVAVQLGAEVTLVERTGLGGSAVLTDCVPSKTLIATAELMTELATAVRRDAPRAEGTARLTERVLEVVRVIVT